MLEKKELLDVPVEGDEERDLTWLDLFLGPKLWQDSRDRPSAGAELIKVIQHLFLGRDLPIQHLFLGRDHQLQRSVYPALLISFLKEDESFQSTQSTVCSLIPLAFLCQESHVYIHQISETDKQASSLPVDANIGFILSWFPLGQKTSLLFPHGGGAQRECTKFQSTGRVYELAKRAWNVTPGCVF